MKRSEEQEAGRNAPRAFSGSDIDATRADFKKMNLQRQDKGQAAWKCSPIPIEEFVEVAKANIVPVLRG